MPRRCFVLYSGGLDSMLALSAMVRQGVEAVAFHAASVFIGESEEKEEQERIRSECAALGAKETVVEEFSETMIALVKHPPHGHGKNLNPCIDCHLAMMERAAARMQAFHVDFLVTGEVLGQRPMSQRRDALFTIRNELKKKGLERLVLRPLSAKLLEPTLPEEEGWVRRDELFDFHGRSRKPQIALAAQWGIRMYKNAGGGCRLTEPGYCMRLRDLLGNLPAWGVSDARLLAVGRHFRLDKDVKIIVGRNEEENERLEARTPPERFLYTVSGKPGATVLLHGPWSEEAEKAAAGIAVYYSKAKNEGKASVERRKKGGKESAILPDIKVVDPNTIVSIEFQRRGTS